MINYIAPVHNIAIITIHSAIVSVLYQKKKPSEHRQPSYLTRGATSVGLARVIRTQFEVWVG